MMVLALAFLLVAAFAVIAVAMLTLWLKAERTSELQQRASQQVQQLTGAVQALENRIAELVRAVPPAPSQPTPPVAALSVPVAELAEKKEEEVAPELLVVMAAAVTVFLGKTVRIRSAKRLQSPYEIVNPWAQQGRVFVQASHNLR